MLMGIDKREIFIDDEDREIFCKYLARAKEKSNFLINGYCLMNNHVHLLMEEGYEDIGTSIKRITVGYVQWHNQKYDRAGHLFQNRYKSEVVEDDQYFLTVLRCIHQNPLKAGLVKDISEYRWCSFRHYLEGFQEDTAGHEKDRTDLTGIKQKLTTVELSLVNTTRAKGFFMNKRDFIEFMYTPGDESGQPLEYEPDIKINDEILQRIIREICPQPEQLLGLPKKERDSIIKKIKECSRASNRQLSKVLGINRGIIERAG